MTRQYLVITFDMFNMSKNYYVTARSSKEALGLALSNQNKEPKYFARVPFEIFDLCEQKHRVIVEEIISGRSYYYVFKE